MAVPIGWWLPHRFYVVSHTYVNFFPSSPARAEDILKNSFLSSLKVQVEAGQSEQDGQGI
jgi:hypothetical protein